MQHGTPANNHELKNYREGIKKPPVVTGGFFIKESYVFY
jgi:hypothetical protein